MYLDHFNPIKPQQYVLDFVMMITSFTVSPMASVKQSQAVTPFWLSLDPRILITDPSSVSTISAQLPARCPGSLWIKHSHPHPPYMRVPLTRSSTVYSPNLTPIYSGSFPHPTSTHFTFSSHWYFLIICLEFPLLQITEEEPNTSLTKEIATSKQKVPMGSKEP